MKQSVKAKNTICIAFKMYSLFGGGKVETGPLQYNHLTQELMILVLILDKHNLMHIIGSAEFVQTV